MSALIDLTGKQFGRWTVLYRDTATRRPTRWICKCSCGTVKSVLSLTLINSNPKLRSTSCGCYRNELSSKRRKTHGLKNSRIYNEWRGIKKRCRNPNEKDYKNYGGRGIRVCDEWYNSFESFYEYVSKLPHFGEQGRSIDRIENEGNYEPGNVRWATNSEQSMNRRTCIGYWDKPHKTNKEGDTE